MTMLLKLVNSTTVRIPQNLLSNFLFVFEVYELIVNMTSCIKCPSHVHSLIVHDCAWNWVTSFKLYFTLCIINVHSWLIFCMCYIFIPVCPSIFQFLQSKMYRQVICNGGTNITFFLGGGGAQKFKICMQNFTIFMLKSSKLVKF